MLRAFFIAAAWGFQGGKAYPETRFHCTFIVLKYETFVNYSFLCCKIHDIVIKCVLFREVTYGCKF